MLKKFEVQNFKNFGERLVFDLSKTNNYEFNQHCVVNGLVNKSIVYGYNGVGKSNLGFAIFDLISHLTDKNACINSYKNYLYAGSTLTFAEFVYTFLIDGMEVIYEYGKENLETLVYEKLTINGEPFASIDRRQSSVAEISVEGAENLARDMSGSKLSVVRYISKNTVIADSAVNRCFESFINFVEGMLFFRSLSDVNYIGFEQGSTDIQKDIIEKGNVKDFQGFLNSNDIDCKLSEEVDSDVPYIAMNFEGRKIRFADVASQGTKSLTIFYYWYQRLRGDSSKVSFLFIDEFDAFYHHELSMAVIKMLSAIKAQVILTTHNTAVMTNELLRPDCYFLMRKNSRMQSLANVTNKELRHAHNIEKMYRAGAFASE